MSGINYSVGKTICFVCGIIILCTPGMQASTLPPDPNNAALLYYQAFLLRPEPDYTEEQLVYNNRAEKIYDILCGGKLEFDADIEEKIQELEKSLKNHVNEPNEIMSKLREMMPEDYIKQDIQFGLSELRKRREHEEKMRGVDPNETIRKYLRKCRDTTELAQAASKLSECDWGIMYSQGLACRLPQLVEMRPLTRILCAEALLLAADGNFWAAFERCLMVRQFAHQVGDDAYILYCVSQSVDYQALGCIKLLLGYMKPDVNTLTWLNNQLDVEKGSPASPAKVLKIDFELALQSLRTNAGILDKSRQAMRKKEEIKALMKEQLTQDAENAGDIQSLTDEELITLAGEPYAIFLDSALQVINSGMSYKEKMSKIEILTEKIRNEFGGDPASYPIIAAHPEKLLTLSIVMACADQALRVYNVYVGHQAKINGIKAAVEFYLILAKTGRLPEKIPDHLPKDPFTGRDFIYEITDEGFALRCQGKDFQGRGKQVLEFRVSK